MSESELINHILKCCKEWAQEEMELNPDSKDTLEERWKHHFDTLINTLNETVLFEVEG